MTEKQKSALIIGNGISRKEFNLNSVGPDFVTFGCNAIYREYKPDFLYAIDDIIIGEIIQSTFPKDRFIVPPESEQYEPAEFNPSRPRENAGMIAMRDAIKKGFTDLYCLGMDFVIDNEIYNKGNLFDGTNGYGTSTRASVADCLNRAAYLKWFIFKNPNVKFNFMFPKDIISTLPVRVAPGPNVSYMYF